MVSALIGYYRIQVESVRSMSIQNLNDRFPREKLYMIKEVKSITQIWELEMKELIQL